MTTSPPEPSRRMVLLTEGSSDPTEAKTAACVLRYKPEEVVAVFDTTSSGARAGDLFGVGGEIPVIGDLSRAPEANTLTIGIAPSGGKVPLAWRPVILAALERGWTVVSGLHDFLNNDPEFAATAKQSGSKMIDIRDNQEQDVATFAPFRSGCLRIHTVGNDCSIGKMLTSVELTRGLVEAGEDAKFIATGQTGIIVEGDGCPVDRVISDFVNGAVEKLVRRYENHNILVIEGQGSLVHPKYSAVTLGLLHGCRPHGMVLCYEVGRHNVHGMPGVSIPPLARVREVFETMANLLHPSEVIGISMNSSKVSADRAHAEREAIRAEFGLPVCDVVRDGPGELVRAIQAFAAKTNCGN